MIESCETEIVELHQFFEDWFCGRLSDTDAAFERIQKCLAQDFVMITPNADIIKRDALIKQLRSMNGAYLDESKPAAIWIEDIKAQTLSDDFCLMRYREWQGDEDKTGGNGRLSSALFQRSAEAPNGVQWLHLHEVWM